MHYYTRIPASGCRLRRRRAGFTLFEILVVIAIIGILAALLFPALARVRENGRAKSCLSNMKQLGMAFQQYTQDYGRRYPGAGQFQKWGGLGQAVGSKLPDGVSGGHWVKGNNDGLTNPGSGKLATLNDFEVTGATADVEGGAIYNYVKSPQVYICPSNEDGEKKRLSYSMNCALTGIHDTRITSPTEIILLIDEDKNNDGFWFADDAAGSTDELTRLHNDGGNILFADYHAKFYAYNTYPLDNSAAGLANKIRQTGSPRFYDRSFGVNGYWAGSATSFGTCEAP